jgi:amidase
MDRGADLHSGSRFESILTAQIPLVMVNMLGLPAVSAPMGIVDDVPVGVQIIGWRFQESLCLEVAEIIERSIGPLYEQLWAKISTH